MDNKKVKEEIRIPMFGGNIIAYKETELDYDGIAIGFEAPDGHYLADIALVKTERVEGYSTVDVRLFGNPYSEDATQEYAIEVDAFYEEADNENDAQ